MTYRIYSTCAAIFAFAFPAAALADVTGTQTLTSGQELNLTAGTVGNSGGDIQWTGSAINFVGGAKGFDLPGNSSAAFAGLTQSIVQSEAVAFSSSSIPSSSLVMGNVFVLETGSGSFAKLMVTANSGGSITLQFDTFGSGGGNPGGGGGGNSPSITSVLDAGSYTVKIPQGGIFVVKGTNMSASGLTSAIYPLQTSLNNVSIKFAPQGGGNATQAYMVYDYNESGTNQLAGLLPSTVQPGTYQVTVTNGSSTSSPASVQVVAVKPGLVTQDSTGSGLAVVQNYNTSTSGYDINRFTTGAVNGTPISPSHPSQVEVAWLTGMGAVSFADNTAPNNGQGYDFTQHGVTVTAYVGGMAIPAAYGGRTGCCAGEDEIVFTLPGNVPTGCVEEFHVTVNGTASQSTFIAVAPAGSDACVLPGYTTSQLQAIDQGATVTAGAFAVTQEMANVPGLGSFNFAAVGGEFYQYSGSELAGAAGGAANFSGFPTGCTETPIPGPAANPVATGTGSLLDAGNITVTGPNGSGLSNTSLPDTQGAYSLNFEGMGATISGQFLPGTYTLSGAGGKDVGAFHATMVIPTILNVSNMPSSVTRSNGLQLNWSGGNSSDPVLISVEATNSVNGVQTGGDILCYTTAGAGGINISASLLNQLPAVSSSAISSSTGVGGIDVIWIPAQSGSNGSFTAPLTAGGSITNGNWGATSITTVAIPFQ